MYVLEITTEDGSLEDITNLIGSVKDSKRHRTVKESA